MCRRGSRWVSQGLNPSYNSPANAAAFARFVHSARNLRLAGGRLRFDPAQLVGKLDAGFAQLMGEIVERVSWLDVCRIAAGHRGAQSEFPPMGVDPMPDRSGIALGAGDVDGAAVAIAAGRVAAAVLGVAAVRLEARGEALAIVVAERAQHRPSESVRIHGVAGVVELLAEVGV